MLRDRIPCQCRVAGCTVGPHYEVFKHVPQMFCSPAEAIHEEADSTRRRSIHEGGHLLVSRAVGAVIDGADIVLHEAHSGAAFVHFPKALKANPTRWGLAQALIALAGLAAERAVLGNADESRHHDGDLKHFTDGINRCHGQWRDPELKDLLGAVVERFIKAHEQTVCHVARQLARYQRLKGSDAVSMMQQMGGIERLLQGHHWEQDLLGRMGQVNAHLDAQAGFRDAHRRFMAMKEAHA